MSGIFGFVGRGNAFVEVRTGLENLSHRGQESWGIVSGLKDGSFSEVRKLGPSSNGPPSAGCTTAPSQSATSATRRLARRASGTRSP